MSRNTKKVSLTVSLPQDAIDFLKAKVENREFASMAHGVEVCILRYKESQEKGERL